MTTRWVSVAALRAHGVPARSRIGFADYFDEGSHGDHVIVEWFDGSRWVATDTQLDPSAGFPVDVLLAADAGDQAAERRLAERYATDPRLHPGDVISCHSPREVVYEVDLRQRLPTTP
ncbi:hypothetical protein ACQP2E_32160 [Actinoplanes sp. CA-015351]|uniref:transglutaminase domain-containing protein n=1 Tax=Actinoplanes sp. CA-015351 TaxID=3239897 RepID=UPI003D99F772